MERRVNVTEAGDSERFVGMVVLDMATVFEQTRDEHQTDHERLLRTAQGRWVRNTSNPQCITVLPACTHGDSTASSPPASDAGQRDFHD